MRLFNIDNVLKLLSFIRYYLEALRKEPVFGSLFENVLFAYNLSSYVEQIKSLIDDEGLRQQLGATACHLIEQNYSYDAIGKQLSDLYKICV